MKIKFYSDEALPLNKATEILEIFLRKQQILTTIFLRWMSSRNIKMESKDKLKETDIKNCTCF